MYTTNRHDTVYTLKKTTKKIIVEENYSYRLMMNDFKLIVDGNYQLLLD